MVLPFYIRDYMYLGEWTVVGDGGDGVRENRPCRLLGYDLDHSRGKILVKVSSYSDSNLHLLLSVRIYDDYYIDQKVVEIDQVGLQLSIIQNNKELYVITNSIIL